MKRPDVKDFDYQIYSYASELSKYADYLENEMSKLKTTPPSKCDMAGVVPPYNLNNYSHEIRFFT